MATRDAPLALVAAIVAIVVVLGGGEDEHSLDARFPAALDLAPGQAVRMAGAQVGSVERVTPEGTGARVRLRLKEGAWPLPRTTVARLRWGGTVSIAARYVELVPGGGRARLADGDVIPRSQTVAPAEFDDMYRIFDRATRPHVRDLVADLGDTLREHEPDVQMALRRAPGALDAGRDVINELGADRHALRELVRTGAAATSAIAARDDDLRNLFRDAAATFDELADHTTASRASLARLPRALRVTRDGLARLDRSIPGLDALLTDIAPGARRLPALAASLRGTVDALGRTAPLATRALRQASAASPSITRLLNDGTPFARQVTRVTGPLAPLVGCMRPYAPEIAGFFSVWNGFTSRYGVNGHVARALVKSQPVSQGTSMSAAEAIKAFPQLSYAFPRPPGQNVGQPWLQPQCGAGEDALDATKDPEQR